MKKFSFEPSVFILYPSLFVIYGPKMTFYYVLSVVFHEMGHIIASLILKRKISRLRFTFSGIVLFDEGTSSYTSDMILSIFGPISGLIFSCIVNCLGIYTLSNVSLVCSLFNMIPIMPLDGGVFLSSLLKKYLDYSFAEKVCKITDVILTFLIYVLGVILFLYTGWNVTWILLAAVVFARKNF